MDKYSLGYRPFLEMQPLWQNDLLRSNSFCLENPIYKKGEKGNNIEISFRSESYGTSKYSELFHEATDLAKRQFGEILFGKVTYRSLMKELDIYHKYDLMQNWYQGLSNYYLYAFALALYFNDTKEWNYMYSKMKRSYLKWELRARYGRLKPCHPNIYELKEWRNIIEQDYSDRDCLIQRCRENSEFKKVKQLNEGRLIYERPQHYNKILLMLGIR